MKTAEWEFGRTGTMEYFKLGAVTLAAVGPYASDEYLALVFYPKQHERSFPTVQECKDWAVCRISQDCELLQRGLA